MGGIIYSGAPRGRFVDGSRRAERRSGILEFADRGIGGCNPSAAASVAHAKGADVARKAGKRSAGNGYGVPILWSAIADAGFAMFVPGLRGGEELGARVGDVRERLKRRAERFLTSAGRRIRRSECGRKSRPAPFEKTGGGVARRYYCVALSGLVDSAAL